LEVLAKDDFALVDGVVKVVEFLEAK